MALIVYSLLGGLIALLGLSIFSALLLAKRTDEMVSHMDEDEEYNPVFRVHFPSDVLRSSGIG